MTHRTISETRKQRARIVETMLGPDADAKTRAAVEAAEGAEEAALFIREMRLAAELTQQELATRLGVNQARISEMERGGAPEGVSYALLRRVAQACGFADWPPSPLENRAKSVATGAAPKPEAVKVTVVTLDKSDASKGAELAAKLLNVARLGKPYRSKLSSSREHVVFVEMFPTSNLPAEGATSGDDWKLVRDALARSPDLKVIEEA